MKIYYNSTHLNSSHEAHYDVIRMCLPIKKISKPYKVSCDKCPYKGSYMCNDCYSGLPFEEKSWEFDIICSCGDIACHFKNNEIFCNHYDNHWQNYKIKISNADDCRHRFIDRIFHPVYAPCRHCVIEYGYCKSIKIKCKKCNNTIAEFYSKPNDAIKFAEEINRLSKYDE